MVVKNTVRVALPTNPRLVEKLLSQAKVNQSKDGGVQPAWHENQKLNTVKRKNEHSLVIQ